MKKVTIVVAILMLGSTTFAQEINPQLGACLGKLNEEMATSLKFRAEVIAAQQLIQRLDAEVDAEVDEEDEKK